MKVTIIIPIRITEYVYEAEIRLQNIISTVPSDFFDILIIDYGTPNKYKSILKGFTEKCVEVISLPVQDKIFNIGVARDTGVQYSKNEIVFFHDIDFLGNQKMYENLYYEIQSRDMVSNAYDFFCIPVFFLTEIGTSLFREKFNNNQEFNYRIQNKIIKKLDNFVDFQAYGSSAIVVNKNHYLSIGGHSRKFYGHGAEDYDILHRLSSYNQVGPKTVNYHNDLKSNQIERYEGFRAFFALYGIDIFQKGMFFVHLWHPKRVISGYQQSNRNFSILKELMIDFDRNKSQPKPLSDLNKKRKALILIKSDSSIAKAIRQALPLFGEYSIMEEETFRDDLHIKDYITKHNIDAVLLLNPYGNNFRLKIYQTLKDTGVFINVFDRGALPDSWFFDSGFNHDSETYSPERWDRALLEHEDSKISEYISTVKSSDDTLEKNGLRASAEYLREKYLVSDRKVLFIPFQRPNDSVVKHFSGKALNMEGFYDWVKYVSESLDPAEWVVLTKKHPLESSIPYFPHTIEVHPDTHINDLLELADKVFVINSGVGLLSLMFGKNVICAGSAFYVSDGLAVQAQSKEEALSLVLNKEPSLCQNKVKAFVHYLVSNVYSFGKPSYKQIGEDGSRQNIVIEILFSSINLMGEKTCFGTKRDGISLDAPLFSSFGGRSGIKRLIEDSKKQKTNQPTKKIDRQFVQNAEPSSVIVKKPRKSTFQRKSLKLIKHPVLFFKDMHLKK